MWWFDVELMLEVAIRPNQCGKVFPATGLSRRLRIRQVKAPDFLDFRHNEGGKVVTLTHRPPLPPGEGPFGFLKVEAPEFLDNRHMKVVWLSALRTGRFYPQEGFLVLCRLPGTRLFL